MTKPVQILRRTVAVVRTLAKSELKLEKLKETTKEAKTDKELLKLRNNLNHCGELKQFN